MSWPTLGQYYYLVEYNVIGFYLFHWTCLAKLADKGCAIKGISITYHKFSSFLWTSNNEKCTEFVQYLFFILLHKITSNI